MYADDTNITTTGKSIKETASGANTDLENIRIWIKPNKLTLNVTKTEYMFIASDSNLDKLRDIPYLVLGGKPIRRVKVSKSLGIFIDERLSWRDHIDKISKTICSGISGLRQHGGVDEEHFEAVLGCVHDVSVVEEGGSGEIEASKTVTPKCSRRSLDFTGKHALTPESKSKNLPNPKRFQI
ncbi:Hypothetical predicted protein, partial [Paramuricea clavata]